MASEFFFTNANKKMVHCVANLGRFVGIIFFLRLEIQVIVMVDFDFVKCG